MKMFKVLVGKEPNAGRSAILLKDEQANEFRLSCKFTAEDGVPRSFKVTLPVSYVQKSAYLDEDTGYTLIPYASSFTDDKEETHTIDNFITVIKEFPKVEL